MMVRMRLLICAGGTGGGVYPALAVLQALLATENNSANAPAASAPEAEVQTLWVGATGGIEVDLVKRAGVPLEMISAGQVHGVGLRALPGFVRLAQGYRQSKRILRQFQPDVLLFTGGYVAVPMALAGHKVPTLLVVPDIEPGLALKILARFADCIAVSAEDSRAFFPAGRRIEVTGYPVRAELVDARRLRDRDPLAARQALGLPVTQSPEGDKPVLLVFGGSKGARSINRALLAVLPQLLEDMHILHISGQLDWPEIDAAHQALADRLAGAGVDPAWVERYHPYPYLHEMGAALAAADLVVCRAGAATLGEFPLLGLPAVLVPYPHAWRYQQVNASFLEQRGAAKIIQDADLSNQLLSVVRGLMRDQAGREKMRRAMAGLAHPQAASSIAKILRELAFKRTGAASASHQERK